MSWWRSYSGSLGDPEVRLRSNEQARSGFHHDCTLERPICGPDAGADRQYRPVEGCENPVSRQITLPLRYEGEFHDGAYDATKDTFEIDQAVLPFRLNEDWALITRTKLPAELLPPKKLGEHWSFGLSNGYTTFFLSPEQARVSTGVWGRFSTIPRRPTRRSASTNGAQAHRRLSCIRIRARGQRPDQPASAEPRC